MKPQFPYDTMPTLTDKFHKARSIFSPGLRIRMNVVPMFLSLFLPWGVFIFCSGISSFWVVYAHPLFVTLCLAIVFVAWLATALMAIWARWNDPDPTWLTYICMAVGTALVWGALSGKGTYHSFSEPYYKIHDLKAVNGIDASSTPGEHVMDAGLISFGPGNHLDALRSWHFMKETLYCVAPVVTNGSMPRGLSYDFWAVGKDCCSTSSSDFRCGSWGSLAANGGWRVMDEGDLKNYHLAVQQAESLYSIKAHNPIFINWAQNAAGEVQSWNTQAFQNFLMNVGFAFVFSLFFAAMASCRFAWLGRGTSLNQEYCDDLDYMGYGYRSKAIFA